MLPWHARELYKADQARAIYEALRDYVEPLGPVPDGFYSRNWPDPDWSANDR